MSLFGYLTKQHRYFFRAASTKSKMWYQRRSFPDRQINYLSTCLLCLLVYMICLINVIFERRGKIIWCKKTKEGRVVCVSCCCCNGLTRERETLLLFYSFFSTARKQLIVNRKNFVDELSNYQQRKVLERIYFIMHSLMHNTSLFSQFKSASLYRCIL